MVGVKFTVNYRGMREANLYETDGPAIDKVLTKSFVYDLELETRKNILREESFSKKLPDFILAPNDRTYTLAWMVERLFELSK
jgi:hypothetical protein